MFRKIVKKAKSILAFGGYMEKLDTCYENLSFAHDYESLVSYLGDAYKNMKSASAVLCDDRTNFLYERLIKKMIDCEYMLESTFILDSNPYFDALDKRFVGKEIKDIPKEKFLDFIVWFVRTSLLSTHEDKSEGPIDFNRLSLVNDCKLASNITQLLCNTLKIPCEVVKINAAFSDKCKLYGGNGFHYFCLVTLDDVKYIVDCTYRQFFTLGNNMIERLGVLGLNGCAPGAYMLMDYSRKRTAINILRDGFTVADDVNLKNYFDGFLLSYRNGLYYEKSGETDYSSSFSVEDYFSFINEEKCLFDYVDVSLLGFQEEPLYDINFRF